MEKTRARAVAMFMLLGAGCLLAVPASVGAQGVVEQPFVSGGRVRIDLASANYIIQAGRDDRILVRWEAPRPADAARVKATIEPRGSEATITVKGPDEDFNVVIELPVETSVIVKLSAGDLRIRQLRGDKTVEAWAGSIDVEVGRREDYRSVRVSVRAGGIVATAFDQSKGGLFRSLSWDGPGSHTLDVRLTAGNVRLR